MRFYLIADNVDTQTGLRLAGVEGVVVHERDEVKAAIRDAMDDTDVAVLLITEKLAGIVPEQVDEMRLRRSRPLVVVIPDRHGTGRAPDSITRYIREAIGVKL